MNRTLKIALLLLCVCVAVPAAYAQAKCSLQTIAGSYAMYERGSSMFVDPSPGAQYFPFFTGATAPFVNIANITFDSKGVGNGYYWIWAGGVAPKKDPIPLQVTVTELNEDCTGKITYVANVAPGLSPTIEERFVVLDNGSEFRTVPTSCQNCIPGVVWTGVSHRISKGNAPVNSCGQQTAHGSYLVTCENIIAIDTHTAVADAFFSRYYVLMGGNYEGKLYESVGGYTIPGNSVWGTITVKPDCSATGTFSYLDNAGQIGGPIDTRYVYFNQGKEFYSMAIPDESVPPDQQVIKYSFCQGKRVTNSSE